jgi:hypothetical protein
VTAPPSCLGRFIYRWRLSRQLPLMPKRAMYRLFELKRLRWDWLPFFGYRSVRRRAEMVRLLRSLPHGTATYAKVYRAVHGVDPAPPAGFGRWMTDYPPAGPDAVRALLAKDDWISPGKRPGGWRRFRRQRVLLALLYIAIGASIGMLPWLVTR